MYPYYRNPHQVQDQRFIGFGLPLLGGFLGGLLGGALISRPFYGYPGFYPPPPPPFPPPGGFPGAFYPGFGAPYYY
ncbi:hypothetical protein M3610_07590 [Neobacillus sp. MER 74]|uniref:hypothetical protein n=1 Tax=Neobacillus sp. MER 74 TaxID=2939566 RepID=UPI00203C5C85|nr:hypothetical protein [Neobacillus sp. MER 74]MCM3115149.1 hypothetical protein [Neobacillus sp. MER 74]